MSAENDPVVGMENPIAHAEPPKSRKKFLIFGGLGCLGLMLLACGGGGFLIYSTAVKPMMDFQAENVAFATSAPEVEQVLGSPVTAGKVIPTQKGPTEFEFVAPLTGPQGSGELVFGGTLNGMTWVRKFIRLDANGEEIDLDPDALFNIEISDDEF